MNKKILISVIFILAIIIAGVYVFKEKQTDDKTTKTLVGSDIKVEIKNFNNIINQDNSKLDIKSCSGLDNLKDVCISQINDRLRPENKFTNTKQCEKVTPKEGESIEKTRDICILNTANRIAKNKNDNRLCNNIKSIDIKSLCKTQIFNKFTN